MKDKSIYNVSKELRKSKFVGEENERIQDTLQVVHKIHYLNEDNTKDFYILKDQKNNVYVYHCFKNRPVRNSQGKLDFKKGRFPFSKRIKKGNIFEVEKWGRNVPLRKKEKYFLSFQVLKHHTHKHNRLKQLEINQTVIKNVFCYSRVYKKKLMLEEIEKL